MNKENIIRKQWLISLFVVYGCGYLSRLMGIIVLRLSMRENILKIATLTIISLVLVDLYCDCAYKKPGTKMLMFIMIIIPCGFARLVAFRIRVGLDSPHTLDLLLYFILMLYFWINCYRLYKVNKAKKIQIDSN